MDVLQPAIPMPQSLVLAPDGSWLVWGGPAADGGAVGQLWLRRLGELDAVPVAGTNNAGMVSVSPDGGELAFIAQGATELRVVPLQGGVPRVLSDSALCCTAWGSDGFIYFTDGSFALRRVPAGGGASEIVVAGPEGEGRASSGLSNSGKVLFFISASMTGGSRGVSAMRLSDGVTKELLPAVSSVRQLPNGDLVYVGPQGTLLAVPFDEGNLRLAGTPVPLAQGLDPARLLFDVSRSGALAYLEARGQRRMQPVWVDRGGVADVIDPDWTFSFNPGSTNRGISLSPDGSRVAVSVSGEEQGANDLWIKQLPRGAFSRLTSGASDETRPRWTADGTSLTYTTTGQGGGIAVIQKADGLTPPDTLRLAEGVEAVAEVQRSPVAPDWFVIRTGLASVGGLGLAAVRVDAEGGESERRPIETPFNERAATISPDGRWIAYESDETGRVEVYVRSFPDVTRRKEQVSASGGRMPAWGRTGSELFFVNDAREMVAVKVRLGEDLRIGGQAALFTIPPDILVPEGEYYTLYDVDKDDQRFLMLRGADQSSGSIVVVLDAPEPQAPARSR
jgi:serine/threonine-protein kinase